MPTTTQLTCRPPAARPAIGTLGNSARGPACSRSLRMGYQPFYPTGTRRTRVEVNDRVRWAHPSNLVETAADRGSVSAVGCVEGVRTLRVLWDDGSVSDDLAACHVERRF